MKKIGVWILAALVVVALTGVVALLGGTILWLIWPVVVPVIFKAGWFAPNISWWVAVLFTWMCGILASAGRGSASKKDE